jgi:excisionase family DNA binding protein
MLTVPEAAHRANRNPETIRRWIRMGRLRAHKIGTQHVIDEPDPDDLLEPEMLPLRSGLDQTFWGEPMLNVVALLRESREGR